MTFKPSMKRRNWASAAGAAAVAIVASATAFATAINTSSINTSPINSRDHDHQPASGADCNNNGIPDIQDIIDGTSGDCNGNGVPDECDIANGVSFDCDADGIPDECAIRYPDALSENTTGFDDIDYLAGPPGTDYDVGLGGQIVTYDFGSTLVIDGIGVDFNVYEVDNGSAEFNDMDVFVSPDGINFVSVKSSETSLHRIPGDESLCCDGYGRSYDLAVSGFSAIRYIRIDGDGDGPSGPNTDFDLSLVGAIHLIGDSEDCCPGDINDSGIVDVEDLLILLATWGDCNGCLADINEDGTVDVNDLLTLLEIWGPCE